MNARLGGILVGLIILALGVAGLFYPERVMGALGMQVANGAHAAEVYGEIRATYGGLFVVMGIGVLAAAVDPLRHRRRLRFIGLLWLGACAGRLFGAYADGSPGLPGWLAAVFELVIGGVLVALAQLASSAAPGSPGQTS